VINDFNNGNPLKLKQSVSWNSILCDAVLPSGVTHPFETFDFVCTKRKENQTFQNAVGVLL
jgi:hypothetical protein